MFVSKCLNKLSDPPITTHPPPSNLLAGSPMKFTTFHQHHHPSPTNGINGNNIGPNFQTIYVANPQQHFPQQQQQHHHQPQQFFEYNRQLPSSSNYVSNSTYVSRMSAPLGTTQFWNQQQHMLRNDFNGNSESG